MKKTKKANTMINLQTEQVINKRSIWALLFLLIIVPTFTKMKVFFFISPVINDTTISTGLKGDAAMYLKYKLLIFFTVVLVILLLDKMLRASYQIKQSYLNVFILILAGVILLSSLLSDFPGIAISGHLSRQEGSITYICYFALAFIAYNQHYTAKAGRYIIYALYPFTAVNTILGLLYFYKIDVLKYPFVYYFMRPGFLGLDPAYSWFTLPAGVNLASTLSNPNYASGVSAVLLGVFLTKYLLDRNIKQQILNLIFALMAFILMLTSLSTSGFIAMVAVFPLIIIMSFLRKAGLRAVISALLALALCLPVFYVLNRYNPSVWQESVGFIFSVSHIGATTQETQPTDTKSLDTLAKDSVKESTPGEIPPYREIEKPVSEYSSSLKSRLDIWRLTLDLIKEKPLLGYGMDTIAYFVDQNAMMLRNLNLFLDKPHSMYLGFAFGAGVPALLTFLLLILVYFYRQMKIFIKNGLNTEIKIISASFFVGTCAYFVQALVNDSVIPSAIIFWIIFGVSMSMAEQSEESKIKTK